MCKKLNKVDPFLIPILIELTLIAIFVGAVVYAYLNTAEEIEVKEKRMVELSEKYASVMSKEDHDFLFSKYEVK
ncbi:hypothetical protein [Vibrio crassostreae]|uniref:hypothetical protein n=1 Tax=Vibrio crassostreae TaxID=246167 RepID=UPI001B3069AC|nr:hypothetical protein [Vibrio crassostreae]